jgi:hypothetical protein
MYFIAHKTTLELEQVIWIILYLAGEKNTTGLKLAHSHGLPGSVACSM